MSELFADIIYSPITRYSVYSSDLVKNEAIFGRKTTFTRYKSLAQNLEPCHGKWIRGICLFDVGKEFLWVLLYKITFFFCDGQKSILQRKRLLYMVSKSNYIKWLLVHENVFCVCGQEYINRENVVLCAVSKSKGIK